MHSQDESGTLVVNGGPLISSSAVRTTNGIAIVELSKDHIQNPYGRPRVLQLTQLIKILDMDDTVSGLILTSATGGSFCSGSGIITFTRDEEIDQGVNDLTDLYRTIAGISTPVVAAIHGSATGLDLQIALCCHYRIGSESCRLAMPELRMGVAVHFDAYMVQSVAGRAVMQKMLFTSEAWHAQNALHNGLLHEIAAEDMTGFRYCSGFPDFVAPSKGKKLSLPYWRREVIEAGLKIHPTCKFGNNREKGHFRMAMERYVPKATAWRTKIMIELGGDYQGGFDRIFGGRDKKVAAFREVLEAITEIVNVDPFANVEHLVQMF